MAKNHAAGAESIERGAEKGRYRRDCHRRNPVKLRRQRLKKDAKGKNHQRSEADHDAQMRRRHYPPARIRQLTFNLSIFGL